MVGSISQEDIQSILHADRNDPFQILGIHSAESAQGVFVRLFYPDLHSAEVVDPEQSEQPWIMDRIHSEGFYEVFIPNRSFFRYLLRLTKNNGEIILTRDPYSFLPLLTDLDIYLFNEGTHLAIYEFLGAHFKTIDETPGMLFCVWAPNARRVSVVGDFNGWDGRIHQMRMIGSSGIWEIFIPNVPTETRYKFEIKTQEGHLLLKSDPLAFYAEKTPLTASLTSVSYTHLDVYKRQPPALSTPIRRIGIFIITSLKMQPLVQNCCQFLPLDKERLKTRRESL